MSAHTREFPMKNDPKILLLENNLLHLTETLKDIKNELRDIRADAKELREEMKIGFKEMNECLTNSLESINNRMWLNFLWMVGIGIGLYGSLFGVIAHALKWF